MFHSAGAFISVHMGSLLLQDLLCFYCLCTLHVLWFEKIILMLIEFDCYIFLVLVCLKGIKKYSLYEFIVNQTEENIKSIGTLLKLLMLQCFD